MRVKAVPEPPPDFDALADARQAVPLVPGPEGECVARLMDRVGVPSQDAAREWLTFLAAIGLIRETDGGYRRTRHELDRDSLAERFRDGVYGADEVLDALGEADGPLAPAELFEQFGGHVPEWERHRHADPETVWRERTGRILEWLVLLGLVERDDGAYRTG